MGFHKDQDTGEIHQIHDQELTDLDTAQGTTFAAADVGKVVRIDDDGDGGNYFVVTASTPVFGLIDVKIQAEVQTTDATETTLYSFTTSTDYNYHVSCDIIAGVDTGGNAAAYTRLAAFKNDSGTLSQIGSTATPLTAENAAGWDLTIDSSGTAIRIRCTGAAATTINWLGYISIKAQKNS